MGHGYSAEGDPDRSAKAAGRDLAVHFKHCVEVCREIRGMDVPEAKDYLEAVIAEEQPVKFKRHDGGAGHRKGGSGPGRYPVDAADAILGVLENAENNAEYKGLDPEEMTLTHCAAQKAAIMEGQQPRAQGRSTAWNTTMSHVEMIIEEDEV